MESKKFSGLVGVSCMSTLMLVIDGVFSRRAVQDEKLGGSADQLSDFAFWPLWLPLLLVQVVVMALAYRGQLNSLQRNIAIFMIFSFLVASMYSLIGHHALTSGINHT